MANMNRARKRHEQGRKVPSSKRTEGRRQRYLERHPQPGSIRELVTKEVPNGQA